MSVSVTVEHNRVQTPRIWRAEVWRVWRAWRWLIVAAWVLILAGTVLAAFPAFTGSGPHAAKVLQEVLYPQLYHITLQSSLAGVHPSITVTGRPSVDQTAGFVAIVCACVLVSFDRTRAGMTFALSGPVRRWHVWTVQGAFTILIPVMALTVKALLLLALDASTGFAIPAHVPLEWWAINGLFDIQLAATALLVVAAVGQVLLAVVASLLLLVLPMLFGGVLAGMVGAPDPSAISINPSDPAAAAAALTGHPGLQAAKVLVQLSPVSHLGVSQGISWGGSPTGGLPAPKIHLDTAVHLGPGLVAWWGLWGIGFLWLSWMTTKTSKAEMWHEPVIRPRFAMFIMLEFAAVLSYLIAEPLRMTVGAPFPVVFPAAFVVLGGTAQWMYRRVF